MKPVEKIEILVDYYTKVFGCSFDLYQKGLLQFHTQYINQDWDFKKQGRKFMSFEFTFWSGNDNKSWN